MVDRASIPLELKSDRGSWPLIVPDLDSLALTGKLRDGTNFTCPKCGTILAFNVGRHQVMDLVICCRRCGAESGFPEVPQGTPLSVVTTVVVSANVLELSGPIQVPRGDALILGHESAERYCRETGSALEWTVWTGPRAGFELDPRTHLARGRTPLPEPIPKLSAEWIDQLCRRLTLATSEILRAHCVEFSEEDWSHLPLDHPGAIDMRVFRSARETLLSGSNRIDHLRFSQALFDTYLLDRWKLHPNISEVTGNLSISGEFRSGTPPLAVASLLSDYGNGVTLIARGRSGVRTPDLCVSVAVDERFYIEVKTPTSLNLPEGVIPLGRAERALANYLAKTMNSTGSGQISPTHPGFVCIAGFGMSDESARNLQLAAERWFTANPSPAGLCGVLVANIGSLLDMRRTPRQPTPLVRGKQVRGTVELRHALSPRPPRDFHVLLDRRRDLLPES